MSAVSLAGMNAGVAGFALAGAGVRMSTNAQAQAQAPPSPPADVDARAFDALEQQGWIFKKAGEKPVLVSARAGEKPVLLSASEALRQVKAKRWSVFAIGPAGQRACLFSPHDGVAVNFFLGDGRDLGLTCPERAQGLKALAQHGYTWGRVDSKYFSYEPFQVYRTDPVAAHGTYWLVRGEVPEYSTPFRSGMAAMPVPYGRVPDLASDPERLEGDFHAFEEAFLAELMPQGSSSGQGQRLLSSCLPSVRMGRGLDEVRVRCGLEAAMEAAESGVPWDGLARGLARLDRLTPRGTAPIDLAKAYSLLTKGCSSVEDLDFRLACLEETLEAGGETDFRRAVEHAASRRRADHEQVEAWRETLDASPGERPAVIVEEGQVRIGGLVVPRRTGP